MRKFLLMAFFPILTGCGIIEPYRKSESNLAFLTIGGNKSSVRDVLGSPDRIRASRKLENGSLIELYEYDIFGKYHALLDGIACPFTLTLSCWTPLPKQYATPYWLQFVDGQLEQWGKVGDWQSNQFFDLTIHQSFEEAPQSTPKP